MALSPRIELRQSQSLVMTPQLQQAIKLLQMSNLELADYVTAEVEKNPLLELAPPPARRRRGRAPAAARRSERRRAAISTRWRRRSRCSITCASRSAPCAAPADVRRGGADPRRRARGRRLPARAAGRGGERGTGCGAADARGGAEAGAGLRSGRGRRARPDGVPGAAAARARPARPGDAGAARQPRARGARARRASCRRVCGVDAEDIADMLAELRALDPKPGLRFAAAAGAERGAGRLRARGRRTAAGRWSSTPRRCRGC